MFLYVSTWPCWWRWWGRWGRWGRVSAAATCEWVSVWVYRCTAKYSSPATNHIRQTFPIRTLVWSVEGKIYLVIQCRAWWLQTNSINCGGRTGAGIISPGWEMLCCTVSSVQCECQSAAPSETKQSGRSSVLGNMVTKRRGPHQQTIKWLVSSD